MKCIKYLALLSFLIISGINNSLAQQQDPYKKFLDSLLRVLPLQKEDSSKALILINITRMKLGAAQNTGRWDEAIEWAQKSLQLSTKTNYQFGIGRANINLGQCWMQKGNYAEAIKYFYAALNLSLKNGRKVLTAASSNHLARCYSLLGNYDEALKHSLIGYEILQQLNNNGPIDEQQQATEIAQLYAKMHRFEEALRWYQKAIPENPGLFYEGDIVLGIASIQMEMKNYPEALKNYRAAVQIYPKRFKRIPEMETAGVSGTWYEQLGEAYFKIGTLTEGSERIAAFNEAINYLNKSLPLLKEGAGGKETLMNAYNLLKQTCEAINDYQGALYYSNLYAALKDSIYNKTTYLKLADQKVKFETEKAASEMNAKQELEKALNEKLLADQKLEQEKMLADERIASEKALAEQKMEQEKAIAIAREKGNYEKSIAVEKVKNEKQRMNNLLLMGLLLVVVTSVFLIIYLRQRHLKKRAEEKAEAIHKMAELEMQSLRAQLNPHFMFNSLNSIQTLILKEDSNKAYSYLSNFSRLLRMLLENAEIPLVPLKKEIEFLKLYLSLESLRVPDLEYSFYTDPSLNIEQILIPNMILQPYVENAIWHGLSYKVSDKQLQVRINRDNGAIKYEVEDNGVGRRKSEEMKSMFRKQHQSKGMEILNKRFKLLNREYNTDIGTQVTDVIKNNEVIGTLVTIKVPIQLSIPLQN